MNNAFLLLAVAAGAYYVGTRMQKQQALPERPLPPLPPPEGTGLGEEPLSPEGASNLELWDAIDFDVDVFPSHALRQNMRPPGSSSSWSVAPDCSAVAVGHGFWTRVNDTARAMLDSGMSVDETHQAVMDELLTLGIAGGGGPVSKVVQCMGDGAEAALMFAEEIYDRVRFISGPWLTARPQVGVPALPQPPQAIPMFPIPNRNRLPTMREAVMDLLGRNR